MSGLFNTLNTANKGLSASQTQLHTTGHNISNVNTRGYSRQRIELSADRAFNLAGVGQLGTGVRMDSIIRISNNYINKQLRNEYSSLAQYSQRGDALNQIEIIFKEPSDTGINAGLGKLFESWAELGNHPDLSASKTVVVEESKSFADALNHMSKQLESLREGTNEEVEYNIKDFNSKLEQLEKLNKQIANSSIKGGSPNDLLDQRDLLLLDMSERADIKASFDSYGRASVTVGDEELLSYEGLEAQLEYGENGDISIVDTDGNTIKSDVAEDIKAGKIRGALDGLKDIENRMDELKNFTKVTATAINTIHSDGNDKEAGFFEFTDDGFGFSIKVTDEIAKDPSKVNAGRGSDIEGDGSRAREIAKLKNTKIDFKDLDNMVYDPDSMSILDADKGTTINGAYSEIIVTIGVSKEQNTNLIKNQMSLVDQLEGRREAESGVSLNEEVSDIIKYQRSYEANAKVISAISDMLDTLINRTGI